MEHERCTKKTPTEFSSTETLPGMSNKKGSDNESVQDTKIDEKEELGNSLASPTPEKPEWSSKAREITSLARKPLAEDFNNEELTEHNAALHGIQKTDKSDELPEKYQILAELFSRMETSVRLLGLRKLLPIFCNIRTQVEVLTKRKFLCSHLAQMKYIFPEAIQIDKILVHDKESLLVVPDMKITLLKEVLEHDSHACQSVSISLCKSFRARLLNFFNSHPESTDIPEAILPEPFNQRSHNLPLEELPENSCIEPPQVSVDPESLSSASLLPSSFKRQFSQKDVVPEARRTQLLATQASFKCTSSCDEAKEKSNPLKPESALATNSLADVISNSDNCVVSQYSESTPVKGSLHLSEMTTGTPVHQTPKRPVPTPHEKLTTENEELVDEARLTTSARRSLIYSPTKIMETGKVKTVSRTQQCGIAKYSSDQTASTTRCLAEEETRGSLSHLPDMVHNLTAANVEDYKLNQMGDGKCYEMLSCLPATFDAICFISQSTNCSLITKEELVHKILSNNLEIEETREVEEHLSLLECLLPDWICKKVASDGQFLYSIKQASDPEAFRARLVEAV